MSGDTTLIIGAGFSHVAGLPLAKDLFSSKFLVTSEAASHRANVILSEWENWKSLRQDGQPEEFLSELHRAVLSRAPWSWAVELVAAILATPLQRDRGAFNLRYAGRITRPTGIAVHEAFWNAVLDKHDINAIVTPNVDFLAERGLRHQAMKRPKRPGFYYGGLSYPQILMGTSLPFSVNKRQRFIELTGRIPLFKLHGSLTWGKESGKLILYQDARAAFRRGGNAQIVPPMLEKEIPAWLIQVWEEAIAKLALSTKWLICGYSLPNYDIAINRLFAEAASSNRIQSIILMDPNASNVAERWKMIAPNADLRLLPGLPEALHFL